MDCLKFLNPLLLIAEFVKSRFDCILSQKHARSVSIFEYNKETSPDASVLWIDESKTCAINVFVDISVDLVESYLWKVTLSNMIEVPGMSIFFRPSSAEDVLPTLMYWWI